MQLNNRKKGLKRFHCLSFFTFSCGKVRRYIPAEEQGGLFRSVEIVDY